MDINQVVLVGRAGRDPEIRYFESGASKVSISMAVNRFVGKDENGNDKKETDWFEVIGWNKTAEIVGEHVRKGDEFGLVGEIHLEKWEDQDGNKHSRHVIKINQFKFGRKKTEGGGSNSGPSEEFYADKAPVVKQKVSFS